MNVRSPAEPTLTLERSWYGRLYARVASLANTPYALIALLVVSVADASIFPIPPFALLVPMVASRPRRWLSLALVGTVASFLGGTLGYYLGVLLHRGAIGFLHIDLNFPVRLSVLHVNSTLGQLLGQNFWVLTLLCSILPTPFKFVSIGSGLVSVPFTSFLLASALGRTLRFFGVAIPVAWVAHRAKRMTTPVDGDRPSGLVSGPQSRP